MRKISAALGTSLVLGMFMVPSCVFADGDTINVTVSVYDYNATDYGIATASKDGVILDKYSVEVPTGTTDLDVVKKALEDNNISITVSPSYYGGSYVSEINGLTELSNPDANPDYSGWMISYNGSFDNLGIGNLGAAGDGVVADGDSIEFHYSVDGGVDIGSSYSGNPILSSLTIGENKVSFTKTVSYDANWNTIFTFAADGAAEFAGDGSEANPFAIKLSLGELESSTVPVAYTASRYFDIKGLDGSWELSNPLEFTVSTQSGLVSHYSVVADYTVKADEPDVKPDEPADKPADDKNDKEDNAKDTGDASILYLVSVMALAGAFGLSASRKYREN